MALDTATLTTDIKALLDQAETKSKVKDATPEQIKQEYAQGLAAALEKFVKSGKVQPGITLTAGDATGATTGLGTIS